MSELENINELKSTPSTDGVVKTAAYQPTPEEIERTRKVMHDSLAARKPKGFFENLKSWFS